MGTVKCPIRSVGSTVCDSAVSEQMVGLLPQHRHTWWDGGFHGHLNNMWLCLVDTA